MECGLAHVLALFSHEGKEILNRVFRRPKVSGEIFEAMNGGGSLSGT